MQFSAQFEDWEVGEDRTADPSVAAAAYVADASPPIPPRDMPGYKPMDVSLGYYLLPYNVIVSIGL